MSCLLSPEKRKSSILDNLGHTNVTIILVTCGLVVVLLIVASIIQVKQPRKKYIIRRDDFDPTLLHEAFEPPHYELCTLRRAASADHMSEMAMAEDFDKFHKLTRSSSKCIRDHHCGGAHSQVSSVRGSQSNLSVRDAAIMSDIPLSQSHQATPSSHRNILMMKYSYSQDGQDGCDQDDDMDDCPTPSQSHHVLAAHQSMSNDF